VPLVNDDAFADGRVADEENGALRVEAFVEEAGDLNQIGGVKWADKAKEEVGRSVEADLIGDMVRRRIGRDVLGEAGGEDGGEQRIRH
jgi:hypothetical protein